jgi:histidine phosphotransferase ChpT
MTDSPPQPSRLAHTPELPEAYELAAHLAARLCHDLITSAGAIESGLELLNDPELEDMRADALTLIAASGRKLVDMLAFDRVAFGASQAADTFAARDLEALTRGVFAHIRAELDWAVSADSVDKPAARVLLNLAQIGGGALPMGGVARVSVEPDGDWIEVAVRAAGARPRLRPEAADGLAGLPLSPEQLGGHWVQAYYLNRLVTAAGGSIAVETSDELVVVRARLPAA